MLLDHLQKNKERIQKFEETRYSQYTYQNELYKACFRHNMAHGNLEYQNFCKRLCSKLV